jgi:hypothetical protein
MFTRYRVDSGSTHSLFFIDSGMYSPAIELVIFTIFHVFSRYRSIAGKHIKNRPHTLECFADFLQNVFGRFLRLAVTQSTHIPREPQCLSPRPNWDSPPPLPQANVGADDWRKSITLSTMWAA